MNANKVNCIAVYDEKIVYMEKAGILTSKHMNGLLGWIFTRIMLINWAHENIFGGYSKFQA